MVRTLSNAEMMAHHTADCQPTEEYVLHCHETFEVYYFVSGRVSYLVEGRQYTPQPESMLLLPPNVFHGVRVEGRENYARYALHFRPSLLPADMTGLLLSPFQGGEGDVYYPQADAFGLRGYFGQVMACDELDDDMRDAALAARIQALLTQVVYMSRKRRGAPRPAGNPTVEEIVRYLNAHLSEPITLDELSARFFISKYYLNTVFKKYTGTTVMNYVIHKRLAAARQSIRQGTPPTDAAQECGFGDYSAFFRAYKKLYAQSPSRTVQSNQG